MSAKVLRHPRAIGTGARRVGPGNEEHRYYYLKDHLGSIRATVDESGTVTSGDDYYPFGMAMDSRTTASGKVDTKLKFTGKERDTETGYDYFGARYYDARIGRWLQVDPFVERYPHISPYVYAINNPLKYYDPNGKDVQPHGEVIETYKELYNSSPSFVLVVSMINSILGNTVVPIDAIKVSSMREMYGLTLNAYAVTLRSRINKDNIMMKVSYQNDLPTQY